GPIRALLWGISTIAQTTGALLTALAALITHPRQGMDSLMGPVGAVTFLGETARGGGEMFLYTAAAMSVLIGIFNLLPIPALDGGRLFFLAVEAVRRRPVDTAPERYVDMRGCARRLLLLTASRLADG